MDRLFLIRHGQTDGTAKGKFMGEIDLPLNKEGKIEAEKLAERLKVEKIAAFYTSPLKRAVETAIILNQFHRLPLKKRRALKEIRLGEWEGLTLEEIYQRDKILCQKWFFDTENFTMPRGESVKAMKKRLIAGWEEIVSRHRRGTVAIITHGGAIRILICYILKLDPGLFWKIRQDTAALNIITFSHGLVTLTLLNDTCHKEG